MFPLRAVVILLVLSSSVPLHSATITMEPNPFLVGDDDSAALLNVVIGDLNGTVLGGFDLTLSYPSNLAVSGIPVFGSSLGLPDSEAFAFATPNNGQLQLFEVSLLSEAGLQALQTNSFVLVSIPFTASGSVDGLLQISGILADAAGLPIAATFSSAEVQEVQNVPEPSPAALVLLGMSLLLPRLRLVHSLGVRMGTRRAILPKSSRPLIFVLHERPRKSRA